MVSRCDSKTAFVGQYLPMNATRMLLERRTLE
jgi:hypothetical protein